MHGSAWKGDEGATVAMSVARQLRRMGKLGSQDHGAALTGVRPSSQMSQA